MGYTILKKPLITEKGAMLTDKLGRYTFLVDTRANKIEIKQEVEKMFSVTVTAVNTITLPAKNKTRYTKGGLLKGKTSVTKKAIISLKKGDDIDLYTGLQ